MQFSIAGVNVMIAVPVNRDFPWQTTKSLLDTGHALCERGIPYSVQFVTGGSLVEKVRSLLAHAFLKSNANKLFWIDSDMAWDAKDFIRLLTFSTVMDVVGATYPAKRGPATEFLMDIDTRVGTNEFGCLPVKGMGLGFTVVRRSVIEVLAQQAPKVKEGDEEVAMIFRNEIADGVFRGEDMTFFADCQKLGVETWVDPSIEIGHVGAKEYRGALKQALRKVEQAA